MWYNDTMMTHTTPVRPDAAVVKETVDMFLARGGQITRCPPRPAQGTTMYATAIVVDGYTLPISTPANEYLPNFVRDLTTYDIAQATRLSSHDDGSVSVVRDDAARCLQATMGWREHRTRTQPQEDRDTMEESVYV